MRIREFFILLETERGEKFTDPKLKKLSSGGKKKARITFNLDDVIIFQEVDDNITEVTLSTGDTFELLISYNEFKNLKL